MRPKLSVIIPAHNEEAEIGKCLDSLSKQTLNRKFFEVIVINNASTDKTVQIAKKYPVKLIYEGKKSVVWARQKGVDSASGEIIVSADADTTYPNGWLKRINEDFKKHPEIVGVVGWIYFSGTSHWFNVLNGATQKANQLLSTFTGKFPVVFAANFAFKKEALMKIGGYPSYLPELGDQQYVLFELFKLGRVIVDPKLKCKTSSRRHHGREVHKILYYNGWFRIVGYLFNRLFKRQLIGPAPAIRTISDN